MTVRTQFLSVALLAIGNLSLAANITYEIAPVSLADGYAISGGFIETDGTLGTLSPSSITAYEATVTGPIPFVFSLANPGSALTISGDVVADAMKISINEDTDTASGVAVGIRFAALDNSTADCFDCHQDLILRNSLTGSGSSTQAIYDHHDHSDDVPDSGLLTFSLASPQAAMTFNAVPEPQAWFAGCFALVGMLAFGRGKRS